MGSENVSHELHVLVEVSLVTGELGFHSLSSSQPISQSTERLCRDVWVPGLLSTVHRTFTRDGILIMFAPGLEEVSVDFKRFLVRDVEVPAPASKGFASGVGVVGHFLGAGSLGGEPVDREAADGVVVESWSDSSCLREPLWIHASVSGLEHASVQLDAGDGAVGVPLHLHRWVSILSNDFSEVLGR